VKFRFAVIAAVFVACLAPSTALAAANPSNHGHHYHYGWIHHHSPPPSTNPGPATAPTGGGTTSSGPNIKSFVATVVPAALAPQAPTVIAPQAPSLVAPRDVVKTAQPLDASRNLWLVAILLAAVVAANVTLVVLATGRAGHYVIRRTFAPVGITV